jgi:hypothetical protein
VVNLTPLTLFNLFLFTLVCNQFFFRYGHIFFGVALHAGWNLTRFAGAYLNGKEYFSEGSTFNAIEGSFWLTGLLTIFIVTVMVLTKRLAAQNLAKEPQYV